MTDLPRNPDFDKNNVIISNGLGSPSPIKEGKHSLNPLIIDEDLKDLVDRLPNVQSNRSFLRFRKQFLRIFESYLPRKGTEQALSADEDLTKVMDNFCQIVVKVQEFVDDGAITKDSVSVKGRNALNEMNKVMTQAVEELQRFVPATRSEEKLRGYTKFQLGAVMVRDGFEVYGSMVSCRERTIEMSKGCLIDVADKQLLAMIAYYELSFHRFCDLMSDLGLYEVMLKCRDFASACEGDMDEDMVIFVDLKTGAIGELYRDDLIDQGLFTLVKDKRGKNVIKEAARDEETETELSKLVINHLGGN